jgi:hypothetical protein
VRIPPALTIGAASLGLFAVLAAGYVANQPRGPALVEAGFGLEAISPNADGDADVTSITYRVRRQATVSIYFEDESGRRFYFRRDQSRSKGKYSVLFGGVVEGFTLPGEEFKGEVLARLLPDGHYTWAVEAVDQATGQTDRIQGVLTVADADPDLPDLWEFSIAPPMFTPNQDGLNDRVAINIYLPKPADLQVHLVDDEGTRYFISESQEGRKPGEKGMHTFDYEGGVDHGASPPPDGVYEVIAIAEDDEGQRVRRTGTLTIAEGGVPLAEIVGQPVGDTVVFSAESLVVGEMLTFTLTVENYGDTPIRTTGPPPGTIYEQNQRASTLGWYEESGAWRVGLDCDTCMSDYPWRWALAPIEELTAVEIDGQTYYYLMPGQRAVVHGGVRLTEIVESRNPQQFWAGLIHEDVGIAPLNNRVDPHWIEILPEE